MNQSSAAMANEQPTREIRQKDDDRPAPAPREAAEAKRLEARRRFLLGGTTAVSVLVTAKRGSAVTWTECAVQIGGPDTQLTGLVPIARRFFGSYAVFGCGPMQNMQSTQAAEPPA
jgi:hypothetical protein